MQQKVVMRVSNDRQTVPLLHPMEERAGERRWPPLSSVLSPLLRRGARKNNPRSEKSSRLATISTDTDRSRAHAEKFKRVTWKRPNHRTDFGGTSNLGGSTKLPKQRF